mgnify:CR=1 FL=1
MNTTFSLNTIYAGKKVQVYKFTKAHMLSVFPQLLLPSDLGDLDWPELDQWLADNKYKRLVPGENNLLPTHFAKIKDSNKAFYVHKKGAVPPEGVRFVKVVEQPQADDKVKSSEWETLEKFNKCKVPEIPKVFSLTHLSWLVPKEKLYVHPTTEPIGDVTVESVVLELWEENNVEGWFVYEEFPGRIRCKVYKPIPFYFWLKSYQSSFRKFSPNEAVQKFLDHSLPLTFTNNSEVSKLEYEYIVDEQGCFWRKRKKKTLPAEELCALFPGLQAEGNFELKYIKTFNVFGEPCVPLQLVRRIKPIQFNDSFEPISLVAYKNELVLEFESCNRYQRRYPPRFKAPCGELEIEGYIFCPSWVGNVMIISSGRSPKHFPEIVKLKRTQTAHGKEFIIISIRNGEVYVFDDKYAFAKDVENKPKRPSVRASVYEALNLTYKPPGQLREWHVEDLLEYDRCLREKTHAKEPCIALGTVLLPVPESLHFHFHTMTFTSKKRRTVKLWEVLTFETLLERYKPTHRKEEMLEFLWQAMAYGYIDKETFIIEYAKVCGLSETEALVACCNLG